MAVALYVRWVAPCSLVIGLLLCVGVSNTFADNPIPIRTIIEHPETYHLEIIAMQGTVEHLQVLEPHDPFQPGDPCYGAYTFTLHDETGVIGVGVLGHTSNCGKKIGDETPAVIEGERVLVRARIHAPGTYVEKGISPLPTTKTIPQAIAVEIRKLAH